MTTYTDDYSTDPFGSPARVTTLAGHFYWDSTAHVLRQDDTAHLSRIGVESGCGLLSGDTFTYEVDATLDTDDAGRHHLGVFVQTVDGQITGYRIAHLDSSWAALRFDNSVNDSNIGWGGDSVDSDVWPAGTTKHLRVDIRPADQTIKLTADGTEIHTWTDPGMTATAFRPGFFSWGSHVSYDNLSASTATDPAAPVLLHSEGHPNPTGESQVGFTLADVPPAGATVVVIVGTQFGDYNPQDGMPTNLDGLGATWTRVYDIGGGAYQTFACAAFVGTGCDGTDATITAVGQARNSSWNAQSWTLDGGVLDATSGLWEGGTTHRVSMTSADDSMSFYASNISTAGDPITTLHDGDVGTWTDYPQVTSSSNARLFAISSTTSTGAITRGYDTVDGFTMRGAMVSIKDSAGGGVAPPSPQTIS